MSSATPAAFWSAMSMMTTSASSFSAIARATVMPTLPAPPTTVTLRFMRLLDLLGQCPATSVASFPQYLWITLLKRPPIPTDRRVIFNDLAFCTIVVRPSHVRNPVVDGARARRRDSPRLYLVHPS